MTTIVAAMTATHVFQISDRRLTRPAPGGAVEVVTDAANKTIMFGNFMAFAFTGLACLPLDNLGREWMRTEDWIVSQLTPLTATLGFEPMESLTAAVSLLSLGLSELYQRRGVARIVDNPALTIVGVGWVRRADGIVPAEVLITNTRSQSGTPRSRPHGRFSVFRSSPGHLPPGRLACATYGVKFDDDVIRKVQRATRGTVGRASGPHIVTQILVDAFQTHAARKRSVGQDLTVVILPTPSSFAEPLVHIFGGISYDRANFFAVPKRSREARGWTPYSPMMISHGVVISSVTVTPLSKPKTPI